MEVLAIMFWLVVLGADIAFMTQIPRVVRELEVALDERKAQRRRAGRAKGRLNKTHGLYHIEGEDAR